MPFQRDSPVTTLERLTATEKISRIVLTPVEEEMLNLLLLGKSNRVIGRELNLSESTVKLHIVQIMRQIRAAHHSQITQQPRWPDGLTGAFERIVLDMIDEGETDVAVDVLLGLIWREADALQATMRDEAEDSIRSNARIEQLLNRATDHQAGTDGWLSRLR